MGSEEREETGDVSELSRGAGLDRPCYCTVSWRSRVDVVGRTGIRGDGDRLGSGCAGGAVVRPALSLRLYSTTNSDIITLDVTTATANLDSR